MNIIKTEKTQTNKYEVEFSIEAEVFNKAVDAAYKKSAGKFNIPGFRKGKAPKHMIEKMYGADAFHYDAINAIFPSVYEEVIAQTKIEPVDRPDVDIVSVDAENGAVIKVEVTVKPDVKLGEYKGLKAKKVVNTVKDEQVDAEITRMQDRNSRLVTRDGAAQNGDITDIDFDGSVDGVHFDGGKSEHFSLTLGSGQFIPGFEEQIVGHSVGEEFDVNVTFPENYQSEDLAGKAAVFNIKLNGIETKELPLLDDEFAKDVSEYNTVDELKASIRKGLQEQADKESELNTENDLVDQIIANIECEIPEVMFETRIDEMVRDFEYRLDGQGLKLKDYIKYTGGDEAKFRDSFKEQAEKQVKIRLSLEAVADAENIVATDEDFDAEVKRIAENYKMEEEKVRKIIPELEVKRDLAVNKAIDFIKQSAIITE